MAALTPEGCHPRHCGGDGRAELFPGICASTAGPGRIQTRFLNPAASHPHPLFFSGLKNKSTAATGKHIHYVGSIYHSVKSNEPQAAFNAFPEKPEAAKLKPPL